MDAHDSVARIELPGEETLLLQALEIVARFSSQTLDLFGEFLRHLFAGPLFGGHLEHCL